MPLILPALFILIVAGYEWHGARAIAWSALLAGGVLLCAAFAYPGLSAADIVRDADAAVAYLVGAARPIGVACLLACVVRRLHAQR